MLVLVIWVFLGQHTPVGQLRLPVAVSGTRAAPCSSFSTVSGCSEAIAVRSSVPSSTPSLSAARPFAVVPSVRAWSRPCSSTQ
jgi:hypothetical protein